MRQEAKGSVIFETTMTVEPTKLGELAAALGTPTAAETATLVPWFGPTVAGEGRLVDAVGLDLSRALLAGHSYEWRRPFRPGEQVRVRLTVDDLYTKGSNEFALVRAEFRDESDELVQAQVTTFIQRAEAA